MTNKGDGEWRTSQFYGGDIAWFNGVLYRIQMIHKRKYIVASGGHFFRQWTDFGEAMSKAEAISMCEVHVQAAAIMKKLHD